MFSFGYLMCKYHKDNCGRCGHVDMGAYSSARRFLRLPRNSALEFSSLIKQPSLINFKSNITVLLYRVLACRAPNHIWSILPSDQAAFSLLALHHCQNPFSRSTPFESSAQTGSNTLDEKDDSATTICSSITRLHLINNPLGWEQQCQNLQTASIKSSIPWKAVDMACEFQKSTEEGILRNTASCKSTWVYAA